MNIREIWATKLVFLATGYIISAWAPLIPFAKDRLTLDTATLGLLLLFLGAGSLVAMPITGLLAARYGCRHIIAVGCVIYAIALPLLTLCSSFVTMAFALAVFGAAIGSVDVAMNLQAVMVERRNGKAMMSLFHGLYAFGGIVGAAGVSSLLTLGLSPFAASGCFSILTIAIVILNYGGLLPGSTGQALAQRSSTRPNRFVLLLAALSCVVFLAEGAVLDWAALYLIDERGVDLDHAGYGFAVFALCLTLGRFVGDRLLRAFGPSKIVVVGSITAAVGFLLVFALPTGFGVLFGFGLVGFGAANCVPTFFKLAGNQNNRSSGHDLAVVTTSGYLGYLLGPAALGVIAEATSLSVVFLILAIAMCFVGCLFRAAA